MFAASLIFRRGYFKPLKFVSQLESLKPANVPSIATYRVLDNDGKVLNSKEEPKVFDVLIVISPM